jgi:hypothetical protein
VSAEIKLEADTASRKKVRHENAEKEKGQEEGQEINATATPPHATTQPLRAIQEAEVGLWHKFGYSIHRIRRESLSRAGAKKGEPYKWRKDIIIVITGAIAARIHSGFLAG